MNIRSYRKQIREMKVGDTFYLNAINCTLAMVDYTKELLKNGKIRPEQSELDRTIYPEYQQDFISGKSIAPQMMYEVIK